MRNLPLDRMQAEWLVDLLEKCDPKETGTWRHELASEIRELFGMSAFPEWNTIQGVKLPAWFWDRTHRMPFTGQVPPGEDRVL